MHHQCAGCGALKAASDFYTSNRSKCKECVKAQVRKNRADNIEHYRTYDRQRANLPHRVAAREAYRQTEAYAASHAAASARYYAAHPGRRAATIAVGNAVRDGRLIPWPVCAIPDCCAKPEAHHPDYSRPLDVVWLCQPHHKQAHALVEKIERDKEAA